MPRRPTLLAALAAAAAMAGLSAVGGAGVAAAGSAARRAADAPLAITIDKLTPSSIPRQGNVRVSGWVTNTSDEVWSLVNVHTFIGADPITTTADLDFESTRGVEESVGDRITAPGTFDTIPELAPGASASYTVRVPADQLGADEPGVYWFGVHALGQTAAGRDSVADGRARTFLPLVPRTDTPIDTALVLPVRHQTLHEADGSLADSEAWAQTLGEGGQLHDVLDFGVAAGARPITWLVDPAVPAAVRQLQDGNPARSLVTPVEGDDGATASPSPSDAESGEPSPAPAEPAADDPALVAEAWLARLQQALTGKQVLALPWGDVDVAAAAKHAPDVYVDARTRSGTALTLGNFPMAPAISAPNGFLDDAALALADATTTVLVSDRAVSRGQAPSVASYAGHRLILYSAEGATGGPGPDDPLAPIALRQRILSEAALRMNEPGRQPLVVVFPPGWTPPDGAAFFDGIDVNWMHLATLTDATPQPGRPLAADRFEYPSWQVNHEVDDEAFNAIATLGDEADRLQSVLAEPSDVASRIRGEALGDVSYFARNDALRSRLATVNTTGWVRARLHSISVAAPRRVILSSNSGTFSVTITNGLDEPVTVRIEATSTPPMTITGPEIVQLAAGSSTPVLLEATTDKLGVHDVTIALTDEAGNPLGSTDQLPVRAAAVSQVIWLIMGVAVALLLVAIVIRLVRRIRGRGDDDGNDDGGDDDNSPTGHAEADPAPAPLGVAPGAPGARSDR